MNAMAQTRFNTMLTTPTGHTLVVEESDGEARSIGSFSVRLYEPAPKPDKTTFFITGLFQARDGAIENAELADTNGDETQELVVTVRAEGTGGFLSAHAFAVSNDSLTLVSSVEGLAADADIISSLRQNSAYIVY